MGPEGGTDQKSNEEKEVDGHGDEEQNIQQGAFNHGVDSTQNWKMLGKYIFTFIVEIITKDHD